MTKKTASLLFLITILGALLRFRDITVNPPGINTDEAAIGYNAYSLYKTGRDEYSQPWPLTFRSFDDYKPPLYVYLTIPSVAIFGLNELAVRFPSALLGILAIITTYFLTYELFKNRAISLAAGFFLAVSPWHIQFTRTAYETGSNAFFTSLGLLLFLKGLKNWWFWLFSGLVFGLQTHLYQASKIFVPLLLFCLFLIYLPQIKKKIFTVIFFTVPFLVIFLPVVFLATSSAGLLRFRGTSVFQDPKSHERELAYEQTDWLLNDNKSVILFHPPFMTYFQDILVGYLSHFRPDFLLASRGDSKITYVPQVGLMPLWVFILFLAGIYYLLKQRDKKATFLLLSWLFVAPIPASVTMGLPSSIRTTVFLPSMEIISAFGLINFFQMMAGSYPKFKKYIVAIFLLFVIYSFALYLHMLLVHAPSLGAKFWYSNYKSIVTDSLNLSPKYSKIIISTKLDEPHIFYLFFLKYDPQKYLQEGGTVGGGFSEENNHLGNKFFFRPVDWNKMKSEPNQLLVAVAAEVPTEAKNNIVEKIFSKDGEVLAYFLETR